MLAPLILLAAAHCCFAQQYVGISSSEPLPAQPSGFRQILLRKTDGSVIRAPVLESQVGFENVRISPDGRRVAWIALMPNTGTSYPIPLKLVVFKADRIERSIEDRSCIFGWNFRHGGSEIAYFADTLHFSTGKEAVLRDTASGRVLARYGLSRIDGEIQPAALKKAPAWVREIPGIGE